MYNLPAVHLSLAFRSVGANLCVRPCKNDDSAKSSASQLSFTFHYVGTIPCVCPIKDASWSTIWKIVHTSDARSNRQPLMV